MKNFIIFLLVCSVSNAQSLSSLTGYYNIPIANILEDREITIGAYYIPYRFSSEKEFDRDAIAYYASCGFLPFMEMSLRFTKRLGPKYALGDRMFSFKIRFMEEGVYFPSLAIGAQDFFHSTDAVTNRYNSLYLVITKNISVGSIINNLSLTAGYGSDIIKANGYEYLGLFGGLSLTILEHLEFLFENDARFYNLGVRIELFEHIFLLGGYRGLKYFSGGGGIYFQL